LKLYLHIGTEKTGSSYVQSLLALNREQLLQHNIHYPRAGKREKAMISGRISPGNGNTLFKLLQLNNDNLLKQHLKQFIDEAKFKGCDSIFLSNENLIEVLSIKEIIKRLLIQCKDLGITPIKYLLIIRNPVEQVMSLYNHRSKFGTVPKMEDWISNGYQLADVLKNFIDVVRQFDLNCIYRKYDNKPDYISSVVFNDWLRVGDPSVTLNMSVNPSLSFSELLFIKKLNTNQKNLVVDFYERMIAIPSEEKANELKIENRYRIISARQLSKYKETWLECNIHLPENEKIDLPDSLNISYDEVDEKEIICFSDIQAEEIAKFIAESMKLKTTIRIMVRKIRVRLSRIKWFILRLFLKSDINRL